METSQENHETQQKSTSQTTIETQMVEYETSSIRNPWHTFESP